MYNRLDTIPACDRQTDRRKNRQTDILPRHSPRYAHASRGNERSPTVTRQVGRTSRRSVSDDRRRRLDGMSARSDRAAVP